MASSPMRYDRHISDQEFRQLMANFPSGVTIVTAGSGDGTPYGMTCSSLCSVTTSPPTLLVCLRSASPTLAAILKTELMAANFLHGDADGVAELFASGRPDRFSVVDWSEPDGAAGPHLHTAALATADCRVRRAEQVGDHTVVFAEIYETKLEESLAPLLYGQRRFGSWSSD